MDCTSGNLVLTLADGTSSGDALTIKKLDSSSNIVTINGKIDGDTFYTVEYEDESIDLFWNGFYYLIK